MIEVSKGGDTLDERVRFGELPLPCAAGLIAHVANDALRSTSSGHDDLAAIRDEDICARTKDAVSGTGGNATIEILKSLSIGFLKKQIADKTGIEV